MGVLPLQTPSMKIKEEDKHVEPSCQRSPDAGSIPAASIIVPELI